MWPIKEKYSIDKCIFIGNLKLYLQDTLSGKTAHGKDIVSKYIYGYTMDNDQLIFISYLSPTDKYDKIVIDGAHPLTGVVTEQICGTDFKLKSFFRFSVIDMESADTTKLTKINDDTYYFTGLGYFYRMYETYENPIEINYIVKKIGNEKKLHAVTFQISADLYNQWWNYSQLYRQIMNDGNQNVS